MTSSKLFCLNLYAFKASIIMVKYKLTNDYTAEATQLSIRDVYTVAMLLAIDRPHICNLQLHKPGLITGLATCSVLESLASGFCS
jgi:hypothetical protein